MENNINQWEELLYGYFNHSELGFHSFLCADWDEDENITESLGRIYPNEGTESYLSDTLKLWGYTGWVDVVREFEKEVSHKLASLDDQVAKLQYLYNLNNKFEFLFARIPSYQKMLDKLSKDSIENLNGQDFEDGVRISTLMRYIENVKRIVTGAIESNHKTLAIIEGIKKGPKNQELSDIVDRKKLKWLCGPSVSGFIIQELISKKYLQAPIKGGKETITETADICWQLFDFGTESVKNVAREISETTNTLRDTKRLRFKIPPADEIN